MFLSVVLLEAFNTPKYTAELQQEYVYKQGAFLEHVWSQNILFPEHIKGPVVHRTYSRKCSYKGQFTPESIPGVNYDPKASLLCCHLLFTPTLVPALSGSV